MKKNNLKYILAFSIFGLLLSCNDDEDATLQRGTKSVVTADVTNFTLNEGETATVTLTTNIPLNSDSNFKLELVGGNGSFRDYVTSGSETEVDDGYGIIGHKITMPAYATTASFDITPLVDYFPEGVETFEFRLYPMENSLTLVDASSEYITLMVSNVALDEIQMDLDWASTTNAHGNIVEMEYLGDDGDMHSFADVDFDLGFFNGTGFTGNHPEVEGMPSSAPDGDYDVDVDLWDTTGAATPDRVVRYTPMLTISKPGVWVHTIDLSNMWSSNDLGSWTGADQYTTVASINKTGSVYTLTDMSANVLATGRKASNSKKVNPKR